MPKALSHAKCRALLCLVCVKKKPGLRPISEEVKQQIETYYRAGLNPLSDDRLPTKICELCRCYLRDISTGKRRRDCLEAFDYERLNYPPERRNGM